MNTVLNITHSLYTSDDIDEIFAQTLESTEEKREDVLGKTSNKVFQKEIKV